MVIKCSIIGCSNRKDREKDLHYYRLPAVISNQGPEWEKLSADRRREWLAQINQSFENKNMANIRICSAHFVNGKKADLYDRLNPDWAPSVGLQGTQEVEQDTPSVYRFARHKARIQRRLNLESEERLSTSEDQDMESDSGLNPQFATVGTQTDLTGQLLDGMQSEINSLRIELEECKGNTNLRFTEDFFSDNDDRTRQLTGINSHSMLTALFNYVVTFLPSSDSLSKFQVFIMALMRLRLNLPAVMLGFQFGISQATVSRLFSCTVDVLYARLYPSIYWPARETLEKTMPMQFRKHFGRKCAVIIDCFEIFIERPSGLEARAETWSSYKHHNTIKFLIGITPQGTVSFVSKAWGGRTSDKYLTENCGFLSKIMPGDLVLADRGFDIGTSVGCYGGHIQIPAFTRGQSQLSPADLETTRKLANVRIHVERVIGTVRQKYSFLNSVIPIRFLMQKDENGISTIDKIAFICCSLVNMNDSIVAFD